MDLPLELDNEREVEETKPEQTFLLRYLPLYFNIIRNCELDMLVPSAYQSWTEIPRQALLNNRDTSYNGKVF
jgi:hypothetical protein